MSEVELAPPPLAAPPLRLDALERLPGDGVVDPYWRLVAAFLVGYPPHSSRGWMELPLYEGRSEAMHDSEDRTMSMVGSQEPRPLTSLWWLLALFGVALLGVGVFFVVSPHETLSTFAVVSGIFLLVDGVMAITASIFGSGEGRGLLALIGVLSVIAGLILIKKPFETVVVFTLIIGVWFVVEGIVRFVAAFASPEGRGGNILIALLDLIAGVAILAWPDLGLATLAVIIGIALIVRGLLFIFAGWQLHTLSRALDTDRAHAP